MQELSAALTAALLTIDARVTPRTLVDLYEFYETDYVPGVSGFDPDDAIESFAAEEITWNGNAYRREMISRGDVVRNMGEKTNQCTLTFSNISRYMATLATTQQIEGLFLVIRTVVPSVTDDSIVLFVGRCDKPSDIDKEKFTLNARQDFGNINHEIPPREFTAEDPNGRTPSDPLYEGFRIIATNGTFPIVVTTPSTSFFGRLFGRQNTSTQTRQWSSLDSTPYGSSVPIVFGRCQMELIPIFFADIGYNLIGIWVVGEGRVEEIAPVIIRDTRLLKQTDEPHLGDPGGTGDNNVTVSGPINHGYLSKTAYVALSMYGSAGDTIDDPPLVTTIVKGVQVPVPDSAGDYNSEAWTDNPVHIARFILTDPRLVGINEGFMEDSVNYQTALHCDEPIIDDSNGETTAVMQADLPQAGTGIQRFRSTGILDARHFLFHELGDTSVVPEFEDPPFTPIDPADIPDTFSITRFLRKRYTCNFPLTEKMRSVDCLYKVVHPVAKLFLRINKRGKYEIRTEKPSDATMIRAATVYGATAILVQNVVPWKSGDLLQGRIHIGFSLTTSEVRDVSTATYSADGNSITLTTSVTGGGVTSMASGAALAGGSTTVQASGTITIGGTPAAGNTITVTINGVEVTYTLTADDTTGTTAAMLAAYINATPKLNRFIKATWDSASPTIVTLTALLGVLNVSSPLLHGHTAPIADPSTTPVLGDSAGALAAGTYRVAFSDVTALGKTALSPIASRTIAANKQIDVGAIALVGVSRNWYMSDAPNSEYLKFVANTDGSAFSINALPLPGAALPPQYNTTGEEVIRIAKSFSTNSQDIYPVWGPGIQLLNGDIYLPTVPNGHKYEATTTSAAAATGIYVRISTPLDGDTITVNGAVFTFRTSPVGAYEIQISGVTITLMNNIAAVLNASVDPLVSVATYVRVGTQLLITYDTVGTVGNSFTTADSGGGVQAGQATLSGGLDAADTTGTTEPTWPVTSGGTVNDNGVTWTEIGSTYLGQSGLTRANIKKGTFNFPLGSRQAPVNQVKISYRDSNNDFAKTPYRVNDPVHQAQVNKIYPMEVNGEAIDNFNQMFRIANWQLAKNREGDWFYTFGTGPEGLILEEGDVICASDDSGGLVNQVTRVEELRIHPNHDVTIGQARKYSTNMFSDDVGADVIPVPTTLRYVQTVDSLLEFIDNHPHRDEWGLTAGFGVVMSRDLNDEGDWRGASLYADYGDGYVKIAETDIPAVVGETTTTLATVTDPSVWDRDNSVTLTLKFGVPPPADPPFATVDEQDILANARRNLFLIGEEYIQAATVVYNGSQSYTLSNLLRGRFGTDGFQLTHTSTDRVIFLDGSEQLVPIDITRLNGEFNYKAVTVNQDVADATAIPFTWTGGNLRPLSPVNLRGTRDSEGGLLIEWTRRGRLAPGLTPGSDVPVSEETENYVVEIYTPGDVLKRTIPVSNGGGQAAVLLGAIFPQYVDRNNLNPPTTAEAQNLAYTHQEFQGSGAWVEATLHAPGISTATIGLTDPSRRGLIRAAGDVFDVFVQFEKFSGASNPGLSVFEITEPLTGIPVPVYNSGTLGSVTELRIRIQMSGTEIRYYWDYTGPGSVPFYVSRIVPPFPLVAYAQLTDQEQGSKIGNMNVGTTLAPSTIYSDEQQVEDFGSVQNPIRVRVYQVSATVGRGDYTTADL